MIADAVPFDTVTVSFAIVIVTVEPANAHENANAFPAPNARKRPNAAADATSVART